MPLKAWMQGTPWTWLLKMVIFQVQSSEAMTILPSGRRSKKGESNLPDKKDSREKTLNVSGNNGDVNIEFVNE